MRAVITFLFAIIATVSFAQSACQVDIVISVKDASLGNPVANADVLLIDGDKIIKEARTDESGVVTFSADCNHNYAIEIHAPEFDSRRLDVATAKEPVQVSANIDPAMPIKSSAGYTNEFIVRVYNPGTNPVNIRFGPSEKALTTYPVAAGEIWESPSYASVSPSTLWITTGRVVKKYTTQPGKAYQIEFNRTQKCYVIKEVNVPK